MLYIKQDFLFLWVRTPLLISLQPRSLIQFELSAGLHKENIIKVYTHRRFSLFCFFHYFAFLNTRFIKVGSKVKRSLTVDKT